MNLTDNLDKLPKWAQQEVKTLQMRLSEAQKELIRINDNPESNTIMGSEFQFPGEQIKYLPQNQRITFKLPNGSVQCYIKGDCLELHTNAFTNQLDLFVKPIVSNCISIHLK